VLYRTVFSVGTASESTKNSDVFVGFGLRIPIIDKGDPRADKKYIKDLEYAYIKAADEVTHPVPNANASDRQAIADKL
jgi:hypothetical protein